MQSLLCTFQHFPHRRTSARALKRTSWFFTFNPKFALKLDWLENSISQWIVRAKDPVAAVEANRKLPKNKYVLRQQRLDIHRMVLCVCERHIRYFRCTIRFALALALALNRKDRTKAVFSFVLFYVWRISNQHPYSACTLWFTDTHTHTHIQPFPAQAHIYSPAAQFFFYFGIAFLCLSPMNRKHFSPWRANKYERDMESRLVNLPDNTFMRNCPTRVLFISII